MGVSKFPIDISKFKHVKSDKDSTTLQHPQGHTITIAHKPLSKDFRAQLQALSGIGKEAETPLEQDQMQHKMAEGGEATTSGTTTGTDPNSSYQEKLKGVKQGADQPGAISQGISNIVHAIKGEPYADGGKIVAEKPNYGKIIKVGQDKPKDQGYGKVTVKHESPLTYNVANKAKFADGGGVMTPNPDLEPLPEKIPVPPVAEDPGTDIPQAIAATPKHIDPVTQEKREIYNHLSSGRGAWAPQGSIASQVLADSSIKPSAYFGPNGEPPKDFDPHKWQEAEQTYANKAQLKAEGAEEQQQKQQFDQQMRAAAGLAPAIVPNPDTASSPAADINGQLIDTQPPTPKDDFAAPEATFRQGLGEARAGLANEAAAVGAKGQEQAKQYQDAIMAQHDAQNAFQQHYQDLEKERQAHIADIQNGYIDPEKYWHGDANGNGGHSKIATGIGMILAGFNPTNNPNAAINFFKFQMEQNLQAQARNLEAKHNLLGANLKQFGNLRDAADMTRVQMNDALAAQIAKSAANNASPIAKAQAQAAIGHLNMEASQQLQQFAMRRMMMGMMNPPQGGGQAANDPNDPDGTGRRIRALEAIGAHEQASALKEKYVPGVGQAQIPVPDSARQQIATHKSVNDLMNMSLAFSQKYGGKAALERLNPLEREKVNNEAATIQNQLIGQIKQAQHDGVYKESEAKFLEKQIGGSPASFLANFNSVPQIRQMQAIKQQEYNHLLGTYGLKQQALPQQAAEPETKTYNGAKYQKVQGGWKKVQ